VGNLLSPSLAVLQLQAVVVDKQYRAAMGPPPPLPEVDELYRNEASPPPPIHDDAVGVMSLGSSVFKVLDQMAESTRANGLVVNTFEEMESDSTTLLAEATDKKVIAVRSISLCRSPSLDPQSMSCDARQCMAWMDAKAPKSVVYVSFGSARRMPPIQLGMAFASCPALVLWLIKDADSLPDNVKDWLRENTDAHDIAGSKCLVVRGWALEVAILAHPVSGSFMALYGWGSTLEVVAAGLPMATWPFFIEQFIDEQLIVDVLGIGLSVGVMKPTENVLTASNTGVVVVMIYAPAFWSCLTSFTLGIYGLIVGVICWPFLVIQLNSIIVVQQRFLWDPGGDQCFLLNLFIHGLGDLQMKQASLSFVSRQDGW
jgi:hypothetical protein